MGHIGRKGKRSMENVIDKSRAYEAYRLAWDDIAKLLSDQIKAVLGRRFLLRVWPEDQGYWGARALHGLFSVADLNRLLDKQTRRPAWKLCRRIQRPYTVSA